MTPIDHEAAKKWAEETWNTLKNIVLDDVTEADAIEYRNAARAYLDLVSREQRAEELLRKVEPELWGTRWNLGEEIRAFLAERGEG